MRRAALFLTVSALFASAAQAAPATDEPASTLDTIVVSASRASEELRDVSQSMVVVTQAEIRESASENILDLLKKQGFQVTPSTVAGYDTGVLTIRGTSSSDHGIDLNGNILMLIDGRRTGTDSFSILDLNAIERIEVIRGPGAVQYGTSAAGGVVNVITARGTKKTKAKLEAGIGSFNANTKKAAFSGQSADGRFDYALAASQFAIGDYIDGNGARNLNSAVGRRKKYAVNVGVNLDALNRVGLAAQQTDIERTGYATPLTPSTASINPVRDRDYQAVDLTYEGATPRQDKSWFLRYFQGKSSYDLYYDISLTNSQKALNSSYEEKFKGIQGTFNLNIDRFKLMTGIDVLRNDLDQNQPTFPPYGANQLRNTNLTHAKYTNTGVFVIGKAHLLDQRNLVLSAGLRHDTFQSDLQTLYDFRSTPLKREASSTYRKFLPSLGVVYHPENWLKLRANYGYAFKMPAPRQQGGTFYMGNTQYVGNPNLKPEESKTWDVGFDIHHRSLNLYATYFDSDYTNKIASVTSVTPRTYINKDKAFIRGVETGASLNVGKRLGWSFDFTPYYALTYLTRYTDDTGNKLADLAKKSLAFGTRFSRPAWKLSANLDFIYYGQRTEFETIAGGNTVANLHVIKSIADFGGPMGGDLKLKVAVNNLFNKYYQSYTAVSPINYLSLPGRSFYVGLVYDMQ